MRGVGVGRWEAVGNGVEPEVRRAIEGGGAPGPEEARVVVLCVYKRYVEAFVVCKFEHWIYVALSWVSNAYSMKLITNLWSGPPLFLSSLISLCFEF